MEEGMEKAELKAWKKACPSEALKLPGRCAGKGYGKNCKKSPRCKSRHPRLPRPALTQFRLNLKMRQQKENKDINSILAKTSKKTFS